MSTRRLFVSGGRLGPRTHRNTFMVIDQYEIKIYTKLELDLQLSWTGTITRDKKQLAEREFDSEVEASAWWHGAIAALEACRND